MWRARRWRELLNYIDRLPSASHFIRALSEDDEYAEAVIASRGDRDEPYAPALSEWTPEVDLLARISDGIGSLIAMYSSAHGSTVRPAPAPRPRTAFERVRARMAMTRHTKLAAKVLPNRTTTT